MSLIADPWARAPQITGKIALFGGIYNNYLALQTLREEAARLGVKALFCLGDVGGFGPHPDRTFPYLQDGFIQCLGGNYDISLAQGREDCGCGYSDPRDNHFAQISYDYTFKHTSPENKRWLGTLPEALRLRLGPLRLLLCHGSPRQTNEFLWESTTPDHFLIKLLQDAQADVICATHTGIKWKRDLGANRHFVNVGVIGRPENDGRREVWFALLNCDDNGYTCEFRPLAYDNLRLAREMREEGLPEEFVETVETGWWTTCLEVLPVKERLRGRF